MVCCCVYAAAVLVAVPVEVECLQLVALLLGFDTAASPMADMVGHKSRDHSCYGLLVRRHVHVLHVHGLLVLLYVLLRIHIVVRAVDKAGPAKGA